MNKCFARRCVRPISVRNAGISARLTCVCVDTFKSPVFSKSGVTAPKRRILRRFWGAQARAFDALLAFKMVGAKRA